VRTDRRSSPCPLEFLQITSLGRIRARIRIGLHHQWTRFGLSNSQSWPVAGWLAVPRLHCALSGSWSPWHGPCRRAWRDRDLRDRHSVSVGLSCGSVPALQGPKQLPGGLCRLGQCAPSCWHGSKASQPPSQGGWQLPNDGVRAGIHMWLIDG
jgi:hypothetical protein